MRSGTVGPVLHARLYLVLYYSTRTVMVQLPMHVLHGMYYSLPPVVMISHLKFVLVTDIHADFCTASGKPILGEINCGFLDSNVCEIVCEALEDLVVCQMLNESGCIRYQ